MNISVLIFLVLTIVNSASAFRKIKISTKSIIRLKMHVMPESVRVQIKKSVAQGLSVATSILFTSTIVNAKPVFDPIPRWQVRYYFIKVL